MPTYAKIDETTARKVAEAYRQYRDVYNASFFGWDESKARHTTLGETPIVKPDGWIYEVLPFDHIYRYICVLVHPAAGALQDVFTPTSHVNFDKSVAEAPSIASLLDRKDTEFNLGDLEVRPATVASPSPQYRY